MTTSVLEQSQTITADWRDFVALTKPRVMTLVVFTGLCGLLAAPAAIHPVLAFTAILCIALGAGAAAALNQWYEADIDALMKRTAKRPLPAGRMDRQTALHFGVGLGAFSVLLMGLATNWFAAAVLAVSILFYVLVYTVWLKRRTPQNIVIGGLAGAAPPLLGWTAVTGQVQAEGLLLVLIIFAWTPPHFWALAIHRKAEYAKVDIPMLPVTHGERYTKLHILLYTFILLAVSMLPFVIHMSGVLYLVVATGLGLRFIDWAWALWRDSRPHAAIKTFKFSLWYLLWLFVALLADHYAGVAGWL